jgi:hypothetical protein
LNILIPSDELGELLGVLVVVNPGFPGVKGYMGRRGRYNLGITVTASL